MLPRRYHKVGETGRCVVILYLYLARSRDSLAIKDGQTSLLSLVETLG